MRLFVSIRKCVDKASRCWTERERSERKGCGKVTDSKVGSWEGTEDCFHQFVFCPGTACYSRTHFYQNKTEKYWPQHNTRLHYTLPGVFSREMWRNNFFLVVTAFLLVCRTGRAELRSKRSATICEPSISEAFSSPRLQVCLTDLSLSLTLS